MILLAAADECWLLMIASAFIRMADTLLTLSVIVVTAYAIHDNAIAMHTVVGCLSRDGENWTLTQATVGELTQQAFTTREELQVSMFQKLGTLTYRLLGVVEFMVDEHEGHKVQVKGLRLSIDNDLRLNATSLQQLAPLCQ